MSKPDLYDMEGHSGPFEVFIVATRPFVEKAITPVSSEALGPDVGIWLDKEVAVRVCDEANERLAGLTAANPYRVYPALIAVRKEATW